MSIMHCACQRCLGGIGHDIDWGSRTWDTGTTIVDTTPVRWTCGALDHDFVESTSQPNTIFCRKCGTSQPIVAVPATAT